MTGMVMVITTKRPKILFTTKGASWNLKNCKHFLSSFDISMKDLLKALLSVLKCNYLT